MTELLRGSGTAFTVRAVGLLLGVLGGWWIASRYGPDLFGTYLVVVTWSSLLAALCRGGYDTFTLKQTGAQPEQTASLLSWVLARVTRNVSIVAVLWVIAIWWFSRSGEFSALTYALALPLLAAMSIGAVQQFALQGLGQAHAFAPEQLVRPLVFLASLGALWWLTSAPAAWVFVAAAALSACVATVVSTTWLRRRMPDNGSRFDGGMGAATSVRYLFVVNIAQLTVIQVDLLLVGALLGDGAAGVYGVAARIASLAALAVTAALILITPRISAAWARNEKQDIQAMVNMGCLLALGGVSIAFLVLGGFAPVWVGLFGEAYAGAVQPLRWLFVLQFASVIYVTGGFVLNMTGNERSAAWVFLMTAVVNVLLNVTLISSFGLTGAAWASGISASLLAAAVLVVTRRRVGVWLVPWLRT